jgi:23S rRNA (uridine2552-2'-O)-methyltransferase
MIAMASKKKNSGSSRGQGVRVKTAKKRSTSSTRWLQRQLNDPYVQQAKREGYRSRAAFKLLELDEKFGLLHPGDYVVDLGCAPGGWAQVAVRKVGAKGKVIGVDLLEVEPVAGADLFVLDFLADDAPDKIKARLGGADQAQSLSPERPHLTPPPTGEGRAAAAITSSPHRGEDGRGALVAHNYPLDQALKNARALRKTMTDAEIFLWQLLRREQFGVKFRKQHPVGRYIADFACLNLKIIIELDGGQHADDVRVRRDAERTRFLESQGFQVLRFWNHDVMENTEAVVETIYRAVTPSPHRGEDGRGALLEANYPEKESETYHTQAQSLSPKRPHPTPPPTGEGRAAAAITSSPHRGEDGRGALLEANYPEKESETYHIQAQSLSPERPHPTPPPTGEGMAAAAITPSIPTGERMRGARANLVLSDMAANTTGHAPTDHIRIMHLCETAYHFATEILQPGGAFVCKVLKGGTERELLKKMQQDFASVKHAKPASSRADSAESYVVAKGFRSRNSEV